MTEIEMLTDAEIAEVHQSAELFSEVKMMTHPVSAYMSLRQGFDWLDLNHQEKTGLRTYLDGTYGDMMAIAVGEEPVEPKTNGNGRVQQTFECFRKILDDAQRITQQERFINWQVSMPGVWDDWRSFDLCGGFDAVIGNPPWDRMKLQQVEWFEHRSPDIAKARTAAERKARIAALSPEDPLKKAFIVAEQRSAKASERARKGGDYPMLAKGDINLYALFVERSLTLINLDGLVGLVVPSGIASDKSNSTFFRKITSEQRLKAFYDFENRRRNSDTQRFFAGVHSRFKFSIFVAGRRHKSFETARCASFIKEMDELTNPDRYFDLSAEDFRNINPNTGTAPVFRSHRDANLTRDVYGRVPVLVRHTNAKPQKMWPVRFTTDFHMTNDSSHFRTREQLTRQEKAYPIGKNIYDSANGQWVPLYEGKMVQLYDHRAASIHVNSENVYRPAQGIPTSEEEHQDPSWLPEPQYWVLRRECPSDRPPWSIGYKMITAPTNERTLIASLIPAAGVGNSIGILIPDGDVTVFKSYVPMMLANLNSVALDFIMRQKIQGQNINWYIVEQLPIVPPASVLSKRFGNRPASELIRELVLELTYTAHDLACFAFDMAYTDDKGNVFPPFVWNAERRLSIDTKLNAIFFHLYGIKDPDDVKYIFNTFPIKKSNDTEAYGSYVSRDLCLAWMNALEAGNPDATISL
ncbi:MAG: hypothetical protein OXE94_10415 [Aestuariivita sp.]|nr:hypothetical protein [Aestuariivita sp.]MCY4203512.1 hypothetical protein [Aestuariivita sp.]